jgi:hypothetical protein
MLKLTYTNGIRTNVENSATITELLKEISIADSMTIVTTTCTIVVHTGNVAKFYSGMTERDYESLYTRICAPYSDVGETEDKNIFVNAVQIVMLGYAQRLAQYVGKMANLHKYLN